jgi:hypothetical protein
MMLANKAMYKRFRACVSNPEGFTLNFASDVAVKQGCPFSPLLSEHQTILKRRGGLCIPP